MKKKMVSRIIQALHEDVHEDYSGKITQIIALAEYGQPMYREKRRMGFGQILASQVGFIGCRIWLCQAIPFVLCFFIVNSLLKTGYITPRYLAVLISIISVATAAMILPFLYRSIRYSMMETESAAWLSGRRLMLIRVLILLAGDAVFLTAVIAMLILRASMGIGPAIACVSLPFLLATSVLLNLIEKSGLPSMVQRYALLCAGIAVLIPIVYSMSHWIPVEVFTAFQLAASGILLVMGTVQVYRLMKYSDSAIYA